MDSAVIIGSFEFLGFHFCHALLERGYEVKGVHLDNDVDNAILIEKRLEIGRNANFKEESFSDWLISDSISEQTLVLIDFYDYFINHHTDFFEKLHLLDAYLINNKKNIKETNSRVVSLLPIQWHHQKNDKIDHILQKASISHCIYLPSIYGPWQSSAFLFQQYLLKSMSPETRISINDREWFHDLLYIEDIVDPILMLAEKKSASSILKSEDPNHWRKCADYLSIPVEEDKLNHLQGTLNTTHINIIIVKSHLLFSEGIENQKRHLKLLQEGRI
ncbi:Rossmann-fold NAD(P)-binding domain-containing protein [Cytobacillus dafuensis]|uniref:NAD(P)-dependent oxidoreductase n=1 Tax=Cytobacillus dafuensis TaxID=1742359 RepID=A0A5B8Z2G4_CYTDA|nr:hypothetical protein [Cytobacillus dafuensis]QED47224.1 hypothetical protein FSZ17_08155 [Cytobacillus dafuensis]